MSDTVLGVDVFSKQEVVVSDRKRQSGMYVVGVQGMGKSSFLENLIYQDIVKNYPVVIIDPHGDLIRNVIAQMPDVAVKRTYLLDLDDIDWPFSLNLFALKAGEAGDIKLRQMAIDRIIRVCERLFPGESRMLLERLLRVVVHTLVDNPGCSMGDIPRLLHDERVRSRLAKNTSRRAREYWELEYNPLSLSSRSRVTTPLTNRISSLLDNPMLENIVTQKTSSIDFRRSIEQKEIILIKLPVNEYAGIAPIIGTILIAEIYRATFSFRDIELEKRPGFSLYVDEFQNFSTKDFAELFTQGRKFGVRMTVGHQYREQLTEDNRQSTLTGIVASFRVVRDNARELSSSFIDQNAVLREKVVYPDVLKHLPSHSSTKVQSFLRSHIQPLQAKIKEPVVRLPSYLAFHTNADVLRHLEKLMYLAQAQGRIFDEWKGKRELTVVEEMYYDYREFAAYYLGFAAYYNDRYRKRNPAKERLEELSQMQLSPLNARLSEKQKSLESPESFLALLGCKTTSFDTHTKDRSKRNDLRRDIRSVLFFEEENTLQLVFEPQPVDDIYGWLSAFAENNRRLAPLDSMEKMIAIKRGNMEAHIRDLYTQRSEKAVQKERKERYMKSLLYWLRYWWFGCLKDAGVSLEARDLGWDIEKLDKDIEHLEEQLTREYWVMRYGKLFYTSEDEFKRLDSFISFYAALDTPQKVMDWLKKEYEEKEIAPLQAQIATLEERLKTDLSRLDEQLEAEKKIGEAFENAFFDCLMDLVIYPLCEQRPLTASDTAQILESLDKRFALVRTGKSEQGGSEAGVFLMQTLDTPGCVEKSVADCRMEGIRTRTRQKYCRSRLEVEQELNAQKDGDFEDEELSVVEGNDLGAGELDLVRFDG